VRHGGRTLTQGRDENRSGNNPICASKATGKNGGLQRMALTTEIEQTRLNDAAGAPASGETGPPKAHAGVVEPGARVGRHTSIGPHVYIATQVVIGEGCVIDSGAHFCPGTTLEDEVHVGANVAFARAPGDPEAPALVRRGAWIGANASISAGVVVGAKAVVRPGSAVRRSVPPGAIVEGNPANIVGYVDTAAGPVGQFSTRNAAASRSRATVEATAVRGVTVHQFPVIPDLRGNLTVGEFERQIPFTPKRYFMVFDVPSREIRGEHAHLECHQFLICLRGSCAVVADDGEHRVEVVLDSPDRGVYLPPMTWGIQYKYTSDAMLLVFASGYYDSADYIRDHGEFLQRVAQR
jgi:acetyltransferase-like isoleucine patch superfamily enzyme/dTDP-4-dehydrorhamnose 3,5-epimerase-like enzyme